MSTCREIKDLLPGFVDARLATDDLAIVRGHLDACAPCGRERAALQQTDSLLEAALSDHPWSDVGAESLAIGLRARAQAQVRAAKPASGPRRQQGGGGGGVWVAAAAVVLVGMALTLRQEPAVTTPTTEARALASAGESLMRASSDGAFETLAPGAPVRAGERLVAAAPGANLRFEDGTRVELYPDTEVSLSDDADGGVTLALGGLDGEVYCEVGERKRPFRVAARGLDVQVLGTRFLVNHGRRVSRVVVLEGRVLASTRGDRRALGADDAAESYDGEQALRTSRVTGPLWGGWVPRVAEELKRRFAPAPAGPVAPPAPEPEPLAPTPPPPAQPDLDTPVVPPSPNGPR